MKRKLKFVYKTVVVSSCRPQSWEKSASHTLVCTFVFKIYSLCTNVSRHCCESDYRERLLALRSLLLAASDESGRGG